MHFLCRFLDDVVVVIEGKMLDLWAGVEIVNTARRDESVVVRGHSRC